ncbi:hypothetical protein SR39_30350 [Methylobacterium radiotolerans]|nr:hypothetical protein SR39_30350 [Methylobacterium radiotolerans]
MAAAALDTDLSLWSEEPASRPDRARIRARIGGLHCSLCTGTIEKALGSQPGVDKVAVSLTHEQALVEYDPAVARPAALLGILRDIGYTISDPRKVRPYEEEERDLVRESRRFVVAVALSVASIPIIADPTSAGSASCPPWSASASARWFSSSCGRQVSSRRPPAPPVSQSWHSACST